MMIKKIKSVCFCFRSNTEKNASFVFVLSLLFVEICFLLCPQSRYVTHFFLIVPSKQDVLYISLSSVLLIMHMSSDTPS